MNFDPPFWNETTLLPKENQVIESYTVKSIIYSTRYAFYYLCENTKDKEEKLIKFIKLTEEKIPNIRNEVEITQSLNHPNIIKLQDTFRFTSYICLVFPYEHQQSVYEYITKEHPNGIPEDLAVKIAYQMLKALEYLHGLRIWHRNIKPENFFVSDIGNLKVVLGNFEFSKVFQEGEKGTQYLGSFEFMAPEIINHVPYDSSIDIWSLGITFFVMLTGQFPFPSYNTYPDEFRERVSKGLLNYDILNKRNLSQEVKDLVHSMCKFNATERIKIHNALKSPWFVHSTDLI